MAALDEAGLAIAVVAVVGHLGGALAEKEEHVEHMSFEAENGETADEGHTEEAAAVAAAEVDYKPVEHNLDDNYALITE